MDQYHDAGRESVRSGSNHAAHPDGTHVFSRPCSGCLYRVRFLVVYVLVTVMALGGFYVLPAAEDPDCGTIAGCAASIDETCQAVSDLGAKDVESSGDGCRGHCQDGRPVEVSCVTASSGR